MQSTANKLCKARGLTILLISWTLAGQSVNQSSAPALSERRLSEVRQKPACPQQRLKKDSLASTSKLAET
eukprot:30151-Eustigmatos_ZCMA.PRE.1